MSLLDGTDGVFNLGIRFLQQVFRILFRFSQDSLAVLFQFRDFGFVLGDDVLHLLFPFPDVLALGFPVTLVAYDVLQILVGIDVFATHDFGGIGNHFLRQTDFTGNFYSKRATRIADLQLEERLHQVAVVKHGTVHHSLVCIRKMLQILVVGGDDSKRLLLVETLQYRFGNGTPDLRFGTSTEFIDQDEAAFVAVLHHDFHVGQVRRVGTEVVLDALFVTDINEDAPEDTRMAPFVQRDKHPALEHVLK